MVRKTRGTRGRGSYLQLFSFIAVMLLGLTLMLSFILNKLGLSDNGIVGWIERIAIAIALIVPLFFSYYEARRQGTVWFVLWVIAVILVVVFYILNIVGPGRWW